MGKLRALFRLFTDLNARSALTQKAAQERLRKIREGPPEARLSALLSFPVARIPNAQLASELLSALSKTKEEREAQQAQIKKSAKRTYTLYSCVRDLLKEYHNRCPEKPTPADLQRLLQKYQAPAEALQKESEAFFAAQLLLINKIAETSQRRSTLDSRERIHRNPPFYPQDSGVSAQLNALEKALEEQLASDSVSMLQEARELLPPDEFEIVRQLFEDL